MKVLQVGELKARFSQVLDDVRSGEEILVTYGRKKESLAVIVPFEQYKQRNSIKLGLHKDSGLEFADDFAMTEDELIGR